MIEVFARAVERDLPEDQQGKLASHQAVIRRTTDRHDGRRARHCALWAIRTSHDHELSDPRWREIKVAHQVWKDTWFGTEFGGMGSEGMPCHPVGDIELEWTEDAVAVAKVIGEAVGWDDAPWESLLVELIAMEDEPAS